MATETMTSEGTNYVSATSKHRDRIEKLDAVFYIRWTSGPDYEDAFICVDDDEPDMNAIAKVPFAKARLFAEAYRFALSRAASGLYMTCPETALRCESKACINQGCARARHEFKPGPGMSPGICAECGYPASELLQHFPRAAPPAD